MATCCWLVTTNALHPDLRNFRKARCRRQPEADWIYSEQPFAAAREQLTAYFAGDLKEFDLPLRPGGTF
ncbi:MAG: hypothetical protein U5K38_15645 [Woeseiaceae bacterium]|nr:hypothetical protein [Woeseiaceae bacterium]